MPLFTLLALLVPMTASAQSQPTGPGLCEKLEVKVGKVGKQLHAYQDGNNCHVVKANPALTRGSINMMDAAARAHVAWNADQNAAVYAQQGVVSRSPAFMGFMVGGGAYMTASGQQINPMTGELLYDPLIMQDSMYATVQDTARLAQQADERSRAALTVVDVAHAAPPP